MLNVNFYNLANLLSVTIITGHLGSGKTTLLNYVLTEQVSNFINTASLPNDLAVLLLELIL